MIQRRDFVKMSVMAGAAGLIQPAAVYAAGKKKTTGPLTSLSMRREALRSRVPWVSAPMSISPKASSKA